MQSDLTPPAPSLLAIRERLHSAQAEVERRREMRPVPPHQEALLRDALILLEENARLEAQAADLRAALENTSLVRLDDASPCWCPNVREYADRARAEHMPACLAARAALGEGE